MSYFQPSENFDELTYLLAAKTLCDQALLIPYATLLELLTPVRKIARLAETAQAHGVAWGALSLLASNEASVPDAAYSNLKMALAVINERLDYIWADAPRDEARVARLLNDPDWENFDANLSPRYSEPVYLLAANDLCKLAMTSPDAPQARRAWHRLGQLATRAFALSDAPSLWAQVITLTRLSLDPPGLPAVALTLVNLALASAYPGLQDHNRHRVAWLLRDLEQAY